MGGTVRVRSTASPDRPGRTSKTRRQQALSPRSGPVGPVRPPVDVSETAQVLVQFAPLSANEDGAAVFPVWVAWYPIATEAPAAMLPL